MQDSETTDEQLLRDHVAHRDEVSFAQLVRRHVNLVFGTALRILGDRTAAEEVTQNVFITLARKATSIRAGTGLAGWLHRTATREAIALLGLTPSERDDLRNAWADFRFDLQELQVQSAERMPDTNSVSDPNHRSVQFKLSALTNQIPRLREQLDVRLTEAVGSTRAQFLRSPLENRLEDLTTPLGDRDSFITYHAERSADGTVRHWLRFDATDGSAMYQYPVATLAPGQGITDTDGVAVSALTFPINPNSPLWHYRHLFGDQPLLPLP